MLSPSWVFDVADAHELARHSEVVVDVEVVSVADRGVFLSPGDPYPYTAIQVRAVDTIKGNTDKVPEFSVYIAGGTVTLQQVFEASTKETNEKRGLTNLTQAEREKLTETYAIERAYATLSAGTRYVLALNHAEDGSYLVNGAGYGVFSVDGDKIVNVATTSSHKREDLAG
ncbi:hypothetical protein [Microbacterium sp.]|uniref:hypothetical protein n=1 Tax=Microbacterium sp. TaxID=51671 RepID=UPI0039E500BA